jgi:predicted esterase
MKSGRACSRILIGGVVAAACLAAGRGDARGDVSEAVDAAKLVEWKNLCNQWFAAGSKAFKDAPTEFNHPDFWDGTYSQGRSDIEDRAYALPPIPADAVAPLADLLFSLAAKDQNQLEKKSPSWLFDEKRRRGLYLSKPPKKGGGLLVVFAEADEKGAAAAKAHAEWSAAVPEGVGVLTTEVRMLEKVSWNEWSEERFLVHVLEAARRTWDFDTNRVWLVGQGEGGRAAWNFGGRNADLFAGVASIAGGPTCEMNAGKTDGKGAVRADYKGPLPAILGNMAHTAAWFCHAEDDAVRPIHADDIAAELLAKLQANHPDEFVFQYDREKTGGHGGPPKGPKSVAAWLAEKTRDPYPKDATWETQRPTQRQMGWLCRHQGFIDWVRYDARITSPNHIEIHAMARPTPSRPQSGVPDVTILLSPKLIDFDQPLVVECNGKKLFEGKPPRTLWALITSIGHRNDKNQWFEGHVTVQVPPETWRDAWEAPK